jgi:hypothetical protein
MTKRSTHSLFAQAGLTLAVFSILLIAAAAASGATYYVAAAGASDANPGSLALPWATIQHAVDTIANGDTILVKPGTYVGCRIELPGVSGGIKTLKAETPGTVTLNAPAAGRAKHNGILEVETWDLPSVDYWVVDGFVVDGANTYRCIDTRVTNHVTVRNCVAHNARASVSAVSTGIFAAFCDYTLIENCTSYSNSEHGIYVNNSADNGICRNNTLYSNTGLGIHMNGDISMGGDGIMSNWVIEKNVSHNNVNGFDADGVELSIWRNNLAYANTSKALQMTGGTGTDGGGVTSRNDKIYNNTFLCPAGGYYAVNMTPPNGPVPAPVGNKIFNNILYHYSTATNRGSIDVPTVGLPGFESDYNVVMNYFGIDDNASIKTLAQWRAMGYDTHSIQATDAALFVDPAANDYHLKAGSPAIDSGTDLSADVTLDIEGRARPAGSAFDIGAYEYPGGVADLAITTTSLPGGQVGVAYGQTVAATGGITPYSWSVVSGSLPNGLSLGPSTGTISGTPTTSGTSNFTVRVTDSQGVPDTDDQALSVVIGAPADLVVTTSSLSDGSVGVAYSQTVAATGGITPYSWSLPSGSLPSGLGLSTGGVISGTPTATGTSNFTVRVTDSQGVPDTYDQALSITVTAAPTYQFSASDTESTTTSTTYQTKATMTFTPAAAEDWVIFGFAEYKGSSTSYSTLIRMQVDGVDQGAITVEPTVAADYQTFTAVKVANLSAASHTIKIDYASENAAATAYIRNARVVAVRKSDLTINSAAADSTVALTTTLTNYVTLNFTPASAGDYLLVWGAEVSANTAYSTQVQAKLNSTVVDEGLIETKDNTDYSTFTTYSVATLPASAQTLTVTAAKESTSTAVHNIRRARAIAIRLSGTRFASYQYASADTESTTTSTTFQQKVTKSWNVTAAGNWLMLTSFRLANSSASYNVEGRVQIDDSTISAQPLRRPKDTTDYMNAGSMDVRSLAVGTRFVDADYRSSNAAGTAKIRYAHIAALPLEGTAGPADLVITTTTVPNGQIGVAYSQTLVATGGTTPYTWSTVGGTLPSGLSLSSGGVISGTPTATGTSSFTVQVTDSQAPADTATGALSIAVSAFVPDLVITTASVPNGQIGVAYSQTLAATGGVTPYTWSTVGGILPSGLSLSSAGVISGTPTASGTSNFTVRVTDSQGTPDTYDQALSIAIPADLAVTTSSPPNGSVGTAYSQTLAATGGVTPYSWSTVGGTLPSGLSLSSGGVISGTPTATGTSSFTVQVTDSQTPTDTATRALSITVTAGGSFNVTLQDGVNGYTGTSDTWLDPAYSGTNNGTAINADLQYEIRDRQLHMFDLSSIPSNATITSATMSFYVYNVSGTPKVSCYRVLKQWAELEATYNSRLTGTAWGTPGLLSGTDYAATAIVTTGNISVVGWANFNVTSQVQSWVNGSQANYGVMYRAITIGHLYTWMSEYTTDTTVRPKLVVSYTTP